MAVFALIENPLVVFVDNNDVLDYFRLVRSRQPANRTHFVLVNRTSLWSFSEQTESRIAAIFGQPNYAHHYPNTVVPRYAMSMFAKFEVTTHRFNKPAILMLTASEARLTKTRRRQEMFFGLTHCRT